MAAYAWLQMVEYEAATVATTFTDVYANECGAAAGWEMVCAA